MVSRLRSNVRGASGVSPVPVVAFPGAAVEPQRVMQTLPAEKATYAAVVLAVAELNKEAAATHGERAKETYIASHLYQNHTYIKPPTYYEPWISTTQPLRLEAAKEKEILKRWGLEIINEHPDGGYPQLGYMHIRVAGIQLSAGAGRTDHNAAGKGAGKDQGHGLPAPQGAEGHGVCGQ